MMLFLGLKKWTENHLISNELLTINSTVHFLPKGNNLFGLSGRVCLLYDLKTTLEREKNAAFHSLIDMCW